MRYELNEEMALALQKAQYEYAMARENLVFMLSKHAFAGDADWLRSKTFMEMEDAYIHKFITAELIERGVAEMVSGAPIGSKRYTFLRNNHALIIS